MKPLLLLPVLALIVSCSPSTPAARIAKYPQIFESLDTREKALVQKGRIENGLTQPGVWLAWGEPANKSEGQRGDGRFERWTYRGFRPVYTQSFFGGTGYGYGHGYYGRHYPYGYDAFGLGLGVQYVPYPAARVDFQDGRVVEWQRGTSRE